MGRSENPNLTRDHEASASSRDLPCIASLCGCEPEEAATTFAEAPSPRRPGDFFPSRRHSVAATLWARPGAHHQQQQPPGRACLSLWARPTHSNWANNTAVAVSHPGRQGDSVSLSASHAEDHQVRIAQEWWLPAVAQRVTKYLSACDPHTTTGLTTQQ